MQDHDAFQKVRFSGLNEDVTTVDDDTLIYTGSLMAADTGLARSYVSEDAITIAKGLGDLNADQVLLSVVVDVNSHFATKCRQVASPHELAMNPILDELVDLKRTKNAPYQEGISRQSCSQLEN